MLAGSRRLLLTPIVLLAGCGGLDVETSTARQAIINGEACDASLEPTAVAILVDATLSFGFGFGDVPIRALGCTGTLIAPDVVLTAAHCLDEQALGQGFATVSNAKYYISFSPDLSALAEGLDPTGAGSLPDLPADAIEAKAWQAHQEFDINAFNQVRGPGAFKDVGVLFLSQAVTDIAPEIVITREEAAQIETGAPVRIAGWGAQTPDTGDLLTPPPPGTVGFKTCATSFVNEVGPAEFQVGGDSTTSRKCKGDSGGPTYMDVTTEHANTRRVIGITSHAYDTELCNKGGIDTRVDTHLDWLETTLTAFCADGTRVWCDTPGLIPPDGVTVTPEPRPDPEPQPDPEDNPPIGPDPRTDDGSTPTPTGDDMVPETPGVDDFTRDDEGGCRCISTDAPQLPPWWSLGALLLLARRRRASR